MSVSIQGLFETHLTVRKLATSIAFYRDVVGLELAYLLPECAAAFFWIGVRGQAMLGLWEVGDAPNGMRLHLAFTSTVEQILTAPSVLRSSDVVPKGFHGEPVEERLKSAAADELELNISSFQPSAAFELLCCCRY